MGTDRGTQRKRDAAESLAYCFFPAPRFSNEPVWEALAMPRAWIRPFPAMAALCFLVLSLIGSAIILSFPLRPHPEATSDRPPSPSTKLDDQHQRVVLEPILLSDTAELSHSFTLRNHAGHVLTFKSQCLGAVVRRSRLNHNGWRPMNRRSCLSVCACQRAVTALKKL